MNEKLWNECIDFHGHACPGLAIGFSAAQYAMEWFGNAKRSDDEEIVCVTENDACGVDAVQVITGCTAGKGNLIFRQTGKMAFSFFMRESGESVRLCLKPGLKPDDMSREDFERYLLETPVEQTFFIGKPSFEIPESAVIFETKVCELCGEGAPEHKVRFQEGKLVCMDCFKSYDRGW